MAEVALMAPHKTDYVPFVLLYEVVVDVLGPATSACFLGSLCFRYELLELLLREKKKVFVECDLITYCSDAEVGSDADLQLFAHRGDEESESVLQTLRFDVAIGFEVPLSAVLVHQLLHSGVEAPDYLFMAHAGLQPNNAVFVHLHERLLRAYILVRFLL